jgi:hypothetical protein
VTQAGTPRAATDRWTRLPALLLVAVALLQIVLSRSALLDAWSGGGFGMFSTTGVWARRHLHAFALAPGLRRELEVPAALREELRGVLALPTEARLRAFALRLADASPDQDGGREVLALSVYETRFRRETLAPSGALLRGVRVELRGPRP